MAGAVARLGTRRAYLVCGNDGLDEVSLSAPTSVRFVRDGTIEILEWTAADFGLEPVALSDLRADGPAASAAIVRSVLAGEEGPCRRVVMANAAAALLAAEQVRTLPEGIRRAGRSIDSGAARELLDKLCRPAEGLHPER
jgi:anthranilate phosphoribosyltransferase